jgi:hypothetical protein
MINYIYTLKCSVPGYREWPRSVRQAKPGSRKSRCPIASNMTLVPGQFGV